MAPKIEFGNLARGEANPILIKQKTDQNGNTILRIYQRKDLQLISNPFERIKDALKYSLEDFGVAHKTAAKLLAKLGFANVSKLKTTGTENPSELLETIRSGARTGLIDEKSKEEFHTLLKHNNITSYDGFIFYEDTYSDQHFEQDPKYIAGKSIEFESDILDDFEFCKTIVASSSFDNPLYAVARFDLYSKFIEKISEKVKIVFENHFTEYQFRQEFFKKLDKIFYEPVLVSFGAENTKHWLLKHEGKPSKKSGNDDNQESIERKSSIIQKINSAFSNDGRDSDEKKIESMIALHYQYEKKSDVPIIIKKYIYFSVETLLKKNPSLFSKVKDLQKAHDEKSPQANIIDSKKEMQSTGNDA